MKTKILIIVLSLFCMDYSYAVKKNKLLTIGYNPMMSNSLVREAAELSLKEKGWDILINNENMIVAEIRRYKLRKLHLAKIKLTYNQGTLNIDHVTSYRMSGRKYNRWVNNVEKLSQKYITIIAAQNNIRPDISQNKPPKRKNQTNDELYSSTQKLNELLVSEIINEKEFEMLKKKMITKH